MPNNRIEAISDGASPVRGASPGRSPARTGRDDRILKTVLALVIGNPRMGRGQTGPRIHHGLVQVSKAPLSSTVQVLQGVTSPIRVRAPALICTRAPTPGLQWSVPLRRENPQQPRRHARSPRHPLPPHQGLERPHGRAIIQSHLDRLGPCGKGLAPEGVLVSITAEWDVQLLQAAGVRHVERYW